MGSGVKVTAKAVLTPSRISRARLVAPPTFMRASGLMTVVGRDIADFPGVHNYEYEDRYRLRVGDYRVLYEVMDGQLVILVVGVGHRREIYQAMS